MTPTSDERREVAKRLRKLPSDTYDAIKEWEECGLSIYADISDEADYSQIYDAVFGVFPTRYMRPGDYDELHKRLADIIDPTCNVSSVETYDNEFGQLEGWEFHLTCGHSFQQPWNEPPAYCPECGARVVDEDD